MCVWIVKLSILNGSISYPDCQLISEKKFKGKWYVFFSCEHLLWHFSIVMSCSTVCKWWETIYNFTFESYPTNNTKLVSLSILLHWLLSDTRTTWISPPIFVATTLSRPKKNRPRQREDHHHRLHKDEDSIFFYVVWRMAPRFGAIYSASLPAPPTHESSLLSLPPSL